MRPGDLIALDRAIRRGEPRAALRGTGPSAGRRGGRFGRRGGGAAFDPYTPAASAVVLPNTAIWISTSGLTLADGDTTVDSWLAGWGGIRPTLTAPAATNRPAYTAGAVPVLTFDGVDNIMVGATTKGSAWADRETGVVGQRVAFGAAGDSWIGYEIAGTVWWHVNDVNGSAVRYSDGSTAVSTTDPDGTEAHYSGDSAAGTINMRVAGVAQGTTAIATTSRADGGNTVLGGRTAGAYAHVALRAAYIGPYLTTTQRTYLRALLTHHTGIAS